MAIILEGNSISNLQVTESGRTFTQTLNYRLTEGETLVDLSVYIPPVNLRSVDFPGFRVQEAGADWVAGEGGDGAAVVIVWHFPMNAPENDPTPNPEMAPWYWPVQDYRSSSIEFEEAVRVIYDDDGEKPFQSSAGTELLATYTRGGRQVSFGYFRQNFTESVIDEYIGKVNQSAIRIASVDYPAGTVQMKSAVATPMLIKNDDNTTKWRYYRIDVSFVVDSKTYKKKFLNMSTRFIPPGGKGHVQIWCCQIGNETYFGTRQAIIEKAENASKESEKYSPESVTEPMFLVNAETNNGNIQGLNTYGILGEEKQTPTFIEGCPFPLTDFAGLNLPTEKNMV